MTDKAVAYTELNLHATDGGMVKPALIAAGVDRMTAEKAGMLPLGAIITGVVATMPNGTRCIIELGAVRWVGMDEFNRLMHPSPRFGVADW